MADEAPITGSESALRPASRPDLRIARSARIHGTISAGPGAYVSQGTIVRSLTGGVEIGAGSAVLEVCSVVGTADHPVRVGRRTVFGHRVTLVGCEVGDLCEIGNGAVILEGAQVGNRCFLGEGALIPAGAVVPDESVMVGRPARRVRAANDDDMTRLKALRGGDLSVPDAPATPYAPSADEGAATVGTLYSYRDRTPTIGEGTVLFDSAEITGDVRIGRDCVIAGGVKIIGDAHGPVRIGDRVQILENTVLHLLPDNELVVDDDVVIGPGAMIHGCHLGAGTVVEPAANVCDGAVVGADSVVTAGSLVQQRAQHPANSVLTGFPAKVVGSTSGRPDRPGWVLDPTSIAET